MATKKTGGSSSNGRTPNPKYLGVKKFGGELVFPGEIIIRQRGSKYYPSDNVGQGRDFTLFAKIKGLVSFRRGFKDRRFVSVQDIIN